MYDFKFMVSIFDLMEIYNFQTICHILQLDIHLEWLEKEYNYIKGGQGDAFLFQSQMGCIILDLFQHPTDQNEMIVVGIRCKMELCAKIKAMVEAIYHEAPVKSNQIEEGIEILEGLISSDSYPVERPTITDVDGKETYLYLQKLREFHF